ncbi:MAG: hypothetical protein HYX47_18480 [Burkholderiales bacterium]|nr:hypothetical protein [Burkholderiales bacterium]
MQRLVVVMALLAFPYSAHATPKPAEYFETPEVFMAVRFDANSVDSQNYRLRMAFRPSGLVMGAAHTTFSRRNHALARPAMFFVLQRTRQGYRVVEESPLFALADNCDLDEVESQAADRFSARFSCGDAWGSGRDTFRFALRGGEWTLAGRDQDAFKYVGPTADLKNPGQQAPLYGQVAGSSRNYLTGQVTNETFRYDAKAGAVVSTAKVQDKAPVRRLTLKTLAPGYRFKDL